MIQRVTLNQDNVALFKKSSFFSASGINASRVQIVADHGHMDITDHKCLGDLYRKLPQQVKHYKHQKRQKHQKHQSVKFKEKVEQESNYMIDR